MCTQNNVMIHKTNAVQHVNETHAHYNHFNKLSGNIMHTAAAAVASANIVQQIM